ncbi:hypothetical protein EJ05DRAFT_502711 [Pseudovirgaria hyperparasitica]|uniref:C2H2-type domain-containing protein n=1 Tax=Pseudovirgaria hyperparasitica TaxID=470096 RepID=A0A6A6VZZ2_9PEZI|nr:uncharacterized protein EJ05DRAFT_502711 [Pseudovirgaria hyperparasitica]KAF2756248.1 hypothetical protein EJ05DRAFT_502711 [Pseudovirgaria hyperparasitica]
MLSKPLQCTLCRKPFKRQLALTQHLGGTSIPPPSQFHCPSCQAPFCSVDAMRLHQDTVHIHADFPLVPALPASTNPPVPTPTSQAREAIDTDLFERMSALILDEAGIDADMYPEDRVYSGYAHSFDGLVNAGLGYHRSGGFVSGSGAARRGGNVPVGGKKEKEKKEKKVMVAGGKKTRTRTRLGLERGENGSESGGGGWRRGGGGGLYHGSQSFYEYEYGYDHGSKGTEFGLCDKECGWCGHCMDNVDIDC